MSMGIGLGYGLGFRLGTNSFISTLQAAAATTTPAITCDGFMFMRWLN